MKRTEFARILKHKDDKELVFMACGRILEIGDLIKDLESMVACNHRFK